MPATCGLDIDVPLYRSNSLPLLFGGATPARMSCPGAIRSGLSRLPLARSGPREEKSAVNGAATLVTTSARPIVAVAPAVAA